MVQNSNTWFQHLNIQKIRPNIHSPKDLGLLTNRICCPISTAKKKQLRLLCYWRDILKSSWKLSLDPNWDDFFFGNQEKSKIKSREMTQNEGDVSNDCFTYRVYIALNKRIGRNSTWFFTRLFHVSIWERQSGTVPYHVIPCEVFHSLKQDPPIQPDN